MFYYIIILYYILVYSIRLLRLVAEEAGADAGPADAELPDLAGRGLAPLKDLKPTGL